MGFLDLLSPPVCEVEFSNAIAPVGKIGRDIVLMGIFFSEGEPGSVEEQAGVDLGIKQMMATRRGCMCECLG